MSEPDQESSEEAAEKLAGEVTVDSWLDTDPAPVEQPDAAYPDPPAAHPDPGAKAGLWDRIRRAFGARS